MASWLHLVLILKSRYTLTSNPATEEFPSLTPTQISIGNELTGLHFMTIDRRLSLLILKRCVGARSQMKSDRLPPLTKICPSFLPPNL